MRLVSSKDCCPILTWTLGIVILAAHGGCAPAEFQAPQSESVAQPVISAQASDKRLPAGGDAERGKLIGREAWDVYYIGSDRLGYGFTRWRAAPDDAELIAEGMLRLSVKRFGDVTVSEVKMSVVETADGTLRSFRSDARLGPAPNIVTGRVVDGDLEMTNESGGQVRRSSIPWPQGASGYFAVDESLLRRPMRPGERRTLQSLVPIFNQVAEIELRAITLELTELLEGPRELLRIETTTTLPGAAGIEGVLWTDSQGEARKSLIKSLDQIVYRTTREVATGAAGAKEMDLGDRSLVTLARPIPDAHRARQIRYGVSIDDADPARLFVADLGQHVTSTGPHSAAIVVRAVRPDDPPPGAAASAHATAGDDDRQANSFIQSDDPRVIAMAREAAGQETAPWPTAVALERYVHQRVAVKNYSQTFASAAEVAESLQGDCTEHAVLLAALLRARGLPARVAIGLVYSPAAQAFAFHMWTEVFIVDRWIGLDGTLGLGGIGAGHLKLAVSNLKEATAFASFLPVAQVLGKLQIDVQQER
jgi:Transglutaminase-like superfamily